jgi:hypothetical protein
MKVTALNFSNSMSSGCYGALRAGSDYLEYGRLRKIVGINRRGELSVTNYGTVEIKYIIVWAPKNES